MVSEACLGQNTLLSLAQHCQVRIIVVLAGLVSSSSRDILGINCWRGSLSGIVVVGGFCQPIGNHPQALILALPGMVLVLQDLTALPIFPGGTGRSCIGMQMCREMEE